MEIGGFFPYEPTLETENNYISRTCPDADDVALLCPDVVPSIIVCKTSC